LWHSGETPAYLTVVARGSHGGYMQGAAQEDKGTYTKKELLTRIRTALGGRAAELVYYGDEDGVSTGAAADLGSATEVAKAMVCAYGMDEETGLASVDTALLSVSSQPMKRVNEILEKELQNAKAILQENRAAVDALVAALMEKNHLRGKEIDALLSAHAKGAKQ
jgi:ATP-dependent Zn protease